MPKPKNCRAEKSRIERNLKQAIEHADRRGYTGYVGSKGAYVDDPRVKALMRKWDRILKRC